jgi:acyl carrier protein
VELAVAVSRNILVEHILDVIKKESPDQAVDIRMDTKIADVSIDSVDVINILFSLEDEYKVSIDLDIQAQPETVGDLVNALIEFIPHTDDSE